MHRNYIPLLQNTIAAMIGSLQAFSAEELNRVPFAGCWTAAQVADHVIKSLADLPKILTGNSTEADRDPEEKVKMITALFTDYDKKMQSPEFILPEDKVFKIENLQHALNKLLDEIVTLSTQKDLNKTYTDFPFPQMGYFTGQEWFCFAWAHSSRHLEQIKNIYESLRVKQFKN